MQIDGKASIDLLDGALRRASVRASVDPLPTRPFVTVSPTFGADEHGRARVGLALVGAW